MDKRRIVIDNIHGDIELTEMEWRIVNTSTFQRLRSLKQLGMGHLVYPNATHTRFAHSLGVFKIMSRIVDRLGKVKKPSLKSRDKENLRLAALLHDIGHYPYSHLMERIDRVKLTEELLEGIEPIDGNEQPRTVSANLRQYPGHEELGRHILENQVDIRESIGGIERAREVGALFSRTKATNQQLSKLIHSSLDMDRLDYLLRDSKAAGVPYGDIDLNYILNNIRISPSGVLGVEEKAIAAAEHFLLARQFMHRVVYYHKTTYGFEEACRQLLRRMRDAGKFSLYSNGQEVLDMAAGANLAGFNDSYLDQLIQQAAKQPSNTVIGALGSAIANRRPPCLITEVSGLQERKNSSIPKAEYVENICKVRLKGLADKFNIPVGLFLMGGPKPINIEERSNRLTANEARDLKSEEVEELIKIFPKNSNEPKSIVEIDDSVIASLSNHQFAIWRLYFVDPDNDLARLSRIRSEVNSWFKSN